MAFTYARPLHRRVAEFTACAVITLLGLLCDLLQNGFKFAHDRSESDSSAHSIVPSSYAHLGKKPRLKSATGGDAIIRHDQAQRPR